uniref:Uncharacterized protein n=1 Tax=Avena sativa TaxID=4498 RepID=A0ACD5YF95_AVESA
MASTVPPHFVLVPLSSQGHIIPTSDLACLLAERGARVSLVTTPGDAARLQGVADRARRAKLPLEIVELPFQPADDGVAPGSEGVDTVLRWFQSLYRLAGPLEEYVRALPRRPSCIISDLLNPWTVGVARNVGVPRLVYATPSCFYSLCDLNVATHKKDKPEGEFVVPGMPMRVQLTKGTWPLAFFSPPSWEAFLEERNESLRTADGVVVNSFLDIEGQFAECLGAALGMPVWVLGPFFLNNRDEEALAERTDQYKPSASLDENAVTAWLDDMARRGTKVAYVNFGTVVGMCAGQLYEVGHGLEDSGTSFVWVVREEETATPEAREWLEALEARTAGRGLIVRGWAPQVAILSHPAVGGFVTHCGWNSLLESITHGVAVVTWPKFADQILNERLAVDVLGIGAPVSATPPVVGQLSVLRADVARAVSDLLGDGEAAQERRRKAKEYGERAHAAMAEGGSSYQNLTKLVQSFAQSGGNGTISTTPS